LDAGGQAQPEVADLGGGKLTGSVRDADGNIIAHSVGEFQRA